MSRSLRLALVCPRVEPVTAVGAEVQVKKLATLLAARGHGVELLSTCVRDPTIWKNHYHPGLYREKGVPLRRFPVDHRRLSRRWLGIGARIDGGEEIGREDQVRWIEGLGRSSALEEYIGEERGRYDAFLFAPALSGTTWGGAAAAKGRTVILTALPAGPAARLPVVGEMLDRSAALLAGSEGEEKLLEEITGGGPTVLQAGAACDAAPEYDPGRFRRRHGIEVPFLLYSGRRTRAKGVPRLLASFAAAVDEGFDIRLVLTGEESVPVPSRIRDHVLDLHFIEDDDKADGLAAAVALCQPSAREGLGLAAIESWLAGRPVLAAEGGEVTVERCRASGGGIWYGDTGEFVEAVRFLLENGKGAAAMGEGGREHIHARWSWGRALPLIEKALMAAADGGGKIR